MPAAKVNNIAEGQSGIGFRSIFANDQFRYARCEHAPLHHMRKFSDVQYVGGDSTNLHVGVGAGADQREGNYANHLLSDQWTVGVTSDPGGVSDYLYGVKGYA